MSDTYAITGSLMLKISVGLCIMTLSVAAEAQTIAQEARVNVLPAGARAPAWAIPQSIPLLEPDAAEARVSAEADLSGQRESIYDNTSSTRPLARGAVVNDADGVPSATIVSAGSRLAVVMVGANKIQIPLDAIKEDGKLTAGITPAAVESLLAGSARFQAETAKLVRAPELTTSKRP